jgi:hypothetical protein
VITTGADGDDGAGVTTNADVGITTDGGTNTNVSPSPLVEAGRDLCFDEVDNDGDDLIDCMDIDCKEACEEFSNFFNGAQRGGSHGHLWLCMTLLSSVALMATELLL